MGKSIERIPKQAMSALQQYSWDGNVRELRNVVERAMILSVNGTLDFSMPKSEDAQNVTLGQTLDDVEKQYIIATLQKVGWRVRGAGGAAKILGLNPCTLDARMKKLGIKRPG